MPRIREYTNTQGIDAGPVAAAGANAAQQAYYRGQAIEGGLKDLGRGAEEVGNAYGQIRAGELAAKISDIDTQATVEYEKAKQTGALDDPDFVQKFRDEHITSKLDALGSDLQTKQEQELFQKAQIQMGSEYTKRLTADQINYHSDKAVQGWKDSTAQSVNLVTLDPSLAQHQSDMAKIQADALPMSPIDRDKLLLPRVQAIWGASAASLVENAAKDPNITQKKVEDIKAFLMDRKNGYVDNTDPDTFAATLSKLDRIKDTNQSAAFEIAKLQWPDIQTAMREGNPDGIKAADNLIAMVAGSSDKQDRVEFARLTKEKAEAIEFGKATETVRNAPQPVLDANYSALKVKAQAGDKTAAAAITAIDTRNTEFNKDPSGYVASHSPVVALAAAAYQANPSPETFARYASASAGEQTRLYPDRIPKVLTVDMKHGIQQQFSTIEQSPEGATKAGQLLQSLRTQSGAYFNNVMHELMTEHIVTPEQFAAGQLIGRPESQSLGLEILRASAIPGKDLWATSGIPAATAEVAMQKALAPLMQTFSETTNGHELVSSYIQAGANVMRARGKVDASTAAALANTMVMGRFNIRNNLRIPKELDDADVAHGADNVQANINQHDLVPPPSFSGFGGGLQKDAYVRDVQDYGHWITNARGDGAMLRDQYNQPVYENRPAGAPNFNFHSAPGMKQPGNLNPWNRPVLHNADGSYSTTSSMSIGTDAGETLIPTVVNGKRLSKDEAIAHFRKTGENFGTFDTPANADKFATDLHNAQATMFDAHGNKQMVQVPVEIPYKDLQSIGRSQRGVIENTGRFFTAPQTLDNEGKPTMKNVNDIAAAPL